MFRSLIPHAREHNERRLAHSLEDAKQSSNDKNAGEIGTGCMQREHSSPEHDVDGQILGDGDTLDDPIGRIFDDENGNIDACCEPLVL